MKEDAFIATIDAIRTRVSTGDAIIALAIPIEKANQISGLMGKVGHSVGVAFAEVEKVPHRGNYGMEARALKLSSFFQSPDVWKQIGTDEQYLNWVRGQPCSVCGNFNYLEDGREVCEAAHVRRVEAGAGTGIKPKYSAIPLCHQHHKLQHQKGESAIGGQEELDKMRMFHVEQWAWDTLKHKLGYDSWKYVPPNVLKGWADDHNLLKYLPEEYRG